MWIRILLFTLIRIRVRIRIFFYADPDWAPQQSDANATSNELEFVLQLLPFYNIFLLDGRFEHNLAIILIPHSFIYERYKPSAYKYTISHPSIDTDVKQSSKVWWIPYVEGGGGGGGGADNSQTV